MATVNRYTQTQENIYQPRTLQELMVAPAYKRQKHDELDAGIAQYETQLAQSQSLGVHEGRLQEEQKKLYDKMLEQRDKLESEGFTQSSKSNFIRFNKDYQQTMGPQGAIGKIDKARVSYETEKENLLKNATAMGYGPEKVAEKLAAKYEQYKADYEKTGNITAFEAPLPPKYEDLQSDILEIGKAMKSTTLTKMKQNGYEIGIDKGMYVIKTKSGEVLETTNDPNIQSAINFLNNKWVDNGGTGTQSASWQGLTPDVIKDQINNGLGLQREYKNIDQRGEDYKFQTIPEAKTDDDGENLNFIRNKIPGFTISSISPDSPLLALDKVENLAFGEDEAIIPVGNRNESYEDMVTGIKANLKTGEIIQMNPESGLYELLSLSSKESMQYNKQPIYKQGHQIASDLDELRRENPQLGDLTDKVLVERLQAFKENLASNYITDVQLPGSTFEWYSDDLFGNLAGSGEKSAGTIIDKDITINGRQLTFDEVVSDLGYDNVEDFKTKGVPTVNSYVSALGKFKGTVYNSKGQPTNIYIEAPQEVADVTAVTKAATTALMAGKGFAKLEVSGVPQGYAVYIINDFSSEPSIIVSSNESAKNSSDLIEYRETIAGRIPKLKNKTDLVSSYNEVYNSEENNLKKNKTYLSLTGVDKTSK